MENLGEQGLGKNKNCKQRYKENEISFWGQTPPAILVHLCELQEGR